MSQVKPLGLKQTKTAKGWCVCVRVKKFPAAVVPGSFPSQKLVLTAYLEKGLPLLSSLSNQKLPTWLCLAQAWPDKHKRQSLLCLPHYGTVPAVLCEEGCEPPRGIQETNCRPFKPPQVSRRSKLFRRYRLCC